MLSGRLEGKREHATEHISQTWIKDAKRMWLGNDRAIECFIY